MSTSPESKKLLKDQKTTGAHIERFVRNTEKLGAANLTLDTLSNRLQVLEGYWKTYLDRHTVLARDDELLENDSYFINDDFSAAEINYTVAKSFLTERLAALYAKTQDNAGAPSPGGALPALPLATTASSLPKLTLPKFSGAQSEWDSFKDIFTSMVKDVPNITPTLKLQHLLACVEGDAARTIRNLEVTGPNFEVAWTALSRRYENKRLRISTYMKRLLRMQPATKKSVSEFSRLLDTTNECRRGLRTLGEPVDNWDRWFVSLIVFNLDSATRETWEQHLPAATVSPTYDQLVDFLEGRIQALDTAHCPDPEGPIRQAKSSNQQVQKNSKSVSAHHAVASSPQKSGLSCILCKAEHRIGSCPTFLGYTIEQRWKYAREKGLCFNCLSKQHMTASCKSSFRCQVCKQPHHSKLHQTTSPQQSDAPTTASTASSSSTQENVNASISSHATMVSGDTLLGTALVVASSSSGVKMILRALIDPASEGSFITEKVAQALALPKALMPFTVTGVGGSVTASTKAVVSLTLTPVTTTKHFVSFSAAVLPKLSSLLPKRPISVASWQHLQGLNLADPTFATPSAVDCLIGADFFPVVVQEGLRRGPAGSPLAQNTIFGWILIGPADPASLSDTTRRIESFNTMLTPVEPLGDELRKFWELEELPDSSPFTPAEEECEKHFVSTHRREETGRFVVRLPFRSAPVIPGLRSIANQRLLSLERRLQKDASLRQSYNTFMTEYEQLEHMRKTFPSRIHDDAAYLPHHAVVPAGGSRKLRVVFNASQTANNAKSLNDFLHAGPKLQQDISTILLRWRLGRIAFTADIVKMFRQIRVHEDDTRWQRVLWRCSPEEPVQDYDLITVTYGTACAPYLSLRVLKQLALDEQKKYPLGSQILLKNMYVDDAFVCADTEEEALEALGSLVSILRSAGMELDKWATNCPSLLPNSRSSSLSDRVFDNNVNVSTLGLRWTPATDLFSYQAPSPTSYDAITKRHILSEVARIFDPMGWISPISIRAKLLIQHLWKQGYDWDSPADSATTRTWTELKQQLPELQELTIPRWLGISKRSAIFLHGFSDASERAYAAAVYLVSQDAEPPSLIAAKGKVAPIDAVSLPRLELCGALLLSRLVAKVLKDLSTPDLPVHCWTDSQVVLAWLQAPPCTWKTFIANRVSEIHRLLPKARWAHVESKQNPADLASRGSMPVQLRANDLWWHGPTWLSSPLDFPAQENIELETQLEKRTERSTFATVQLETIETILDRFSSLVRLCRAIAYCLRWKKNGLSTAGSANTINITARECLAALVVIVRAVQALHFAQEVAALSKQKDISSNSTLRRHRPFIDSQGLLRLGGRLEYSMLPYHEKHPVIIPKNSRLADLLILDAHLVTLHGGPQLVQSFLLRRWWIIHGRNRIRQLIKSCVKCTRFQGQRQEQLMAPLPAARVTPARPFAETGLDYAGPFALRTSKGRGQRSFKGYVAVFTCLATRAVHLEVVSDYSSKTFLLALRRFIARRGLCHRILSDRGTTFQGAASELHQLFNEASDFSKEVASALANDSISWDFIPPRAPHFGGLWEAAVKSFKAHLKRVIGDCKLTFEEFSTLAAQIEACMNSRPLCPLSADPQDLSALTPGHFLIGSSLLAPPEPFSDEKIDAVSRWKVTTQMRNYFWRRWRQEVLHHMQLRQKWLTPQSGVAVGDLVLLSDDQQPPLKWPLARVQHLHPGPDGHCRVVTLRLANTTLDRPITKLIKLPVNEASPHQIDKAATPCNN